MIDFQLWKLGFRHRYVFWIWVPVISISHVKSTNWVKWVSSQMVDFFLFFRLIQNLVRFGNHRNGFGEKVLVFWIWVFVVLGFLFLSILEKWVKWIWSKRYQICVYTALAGIEESRMIVSESEVSGILSLDLCEGSNESVKRVGEKGIDWLIRTCKWPEEIESKSFFFFFLTFSEMEER